MTAVGNPAAAHLDLAATVLAWFRSSGRDLAFRKTTDPWAVLVSEVMAQQTQAGRAAAAWTAFMRRYPTPAALAAASPAEVILAWRGLGYNRRAVALRAAAIRIVEDHGGFVPESLDALVALPGIGPYTARAVLAIAFGRPVAALDTNVRRVLDRALGPLPAAERALQAAADGYVPSGRSAAWTHALMDIGATICRKRDPRCDACPIRSRCRSAGRIVTPARATGARGTGARGTGPRGSSTPVRFESTSRWLRGRILDRLRDAETGAWVPLDQPIGEHPARAVRAAVLALAGEGLIEVAGSGGTRARLAG